MPARNERVPVDGVQLELSRRAREREHVLVRRARSPCGGDASDVSRRSSGRPCRPPRRCGGSSRRDRRSGTRPAPNAATAGLPTAPATTARSRAGRPRPARGRVPRRRRGRAATTLPAGMNQAAASTRPAARSTLPPRTSRAAARRWAAGSVPVPPTSAPPPRAPSGRSESRRSSRRRGRARPGRRRERRARAADESDAAPAPVDAPRRRARRPPTRVPPRPPRRGSRSARARVLMTAAAPSACRARGGAVS